MPHLSICIPTYNRAEFLDRSLDVIKTFVTRHRSSYRINVCISDNCSTDPTSQVVSKYSNSISIAYSRQKENIGADRNFLSAVSLATGDYVLLLGSDDIVNLSALEDAIGAVANYTTHSVHLFDRLNFKNSEGPYKYQSWNRKFEGIVRINSFHEYIQTSANLGAAFTYISSIIFRRSSWEAVVNDSKSEIESIIGQSYVHVFIFLKILRREDGFVYHNIPLAKNQMFNDSFLINGYLKRIQIDLGLESIFRMIFNDERVVDAVRELINKERTILHYLKAKSLADGAAAQEIGDIVKRRGIRFAFLINIPKQALSLGVFIHERLRKATY